MHDAEGVKLPELPPADPSIPRVSGMHPSMRGNIHARHALYWKLAAKGVPAGQEYVRELYDGRAVLRTRAQLAAIKRRVEDGGYVSEIERSTLACLPARTIKMLDAEAEHTKRVRHDIAVFGDRARAFYGFPPVGSYRTRRPGRLGGRRRPGHRSNPRRANAPPADGEGEGSGDDPEGLAGLLAGRSTASISGTEPGSRINELARSWGYDLDRQIIADLHAEAEDDQPRWRPLAERGQR